MIGFGYFKGMYDANIRASLHDVVKPERRVAAVGVMNAIGWLGGGARGVGDRRGRAHLRDERVPERELADLSVRDDIHPSTQLLNLLALTKLNESELAFSCTKRHYADLW
jgi:hypothetical protein